MNEQLDQRTRTARKPHKCDYCCEPIPTGTRYDWSKYVQDGEHYEWKAHTRCMALIQRLDLFNAYGQYEGLSFAKFDEAVQDHYHEARDPDKPALDYRELGKMVDFLCSLYQVKEHANTLSLNEQALP